MVSGGEITHFRSRLMGDHLISRANFANYVRPPPLVNDIYSPKQMSKGITALTGRAH